jgi:hypothetical protein
MTQCRMKYGRILVDDGMWEKAIWSVLSYCHFPGVTEGSHEYSSQNFATRIQTGYLQMQAKHVTAGPTCCVLI